MRKLVITDLSFCNSEFPGQSEINGGSVSASTAASTSANVDVKRDPRTGAYKADYATGSAYAYSAAASNGGKTDTFAYANTYAK